MDPVGEKTVISSTSPKVALGQFFGGYRAEWLREQLYDLFTEPNYFPELLTQRPCVLMGGRGTGKTTALRCLSYEGQHKLHQQNDATVSAWPFFGMYHRVDTNLVTAFRGPEATDAEWVKLFAHYFNLELCDLVLRFLAWYEIRTDAPTLTARDCELVALGLNVPSASNVRELGDYITEARIRFEAYLNNIVDAERPALSLQSVPVNVLMDRVQRIPALAGKTFFFLLDEYENFLDYQQQVVNTLIKHSGSLYTFKVGVKELGWRVRATLNPSEQLISPADYVLINISDKLGPRFEDFAASVCNDRLKRVSAASPANETLSIDALLPGLTEEEEAEKLGVRARWAEVKAEAIADLTSSERESVSELPPLEALFIHEWARNKGQQSAAAYRERLNTPQQWLTRFDNYKYAFLFSLKRGQVGIRKHYCGWPTFVRLAGNNIRYILELVEQSCILQLDDKKTLSEPIAPEKQTVAADNVGKKNLQELEGLTVQGARLTRLLLGVGRVFQVMASDPLGHTPEVNQFSVQAREPGASETGATASHLLETEQLLTHAVMHLALVRFPGTKLQDPGDIRENDYMPHPIFAPFFAFSHRRKRKMTLSEDDLWGLMHASNHTRTIRAILEKQHRDPDEPLPEQLGLFGAYYAGP